MKQYFLLLSFLFISFLNLNAQTADLTGYVFEANNRGYLGMAKVTIVETGSNPVPLKFVTDKDGEFKVQLPIGKDYQITVEKDVFETWKQPFSTKGVKKGKQLFLKVEMQRKPGYLFDVTIAEKRMDEKQIAVDAISGAKIEIYDNTDKKEVLVINGNKNPAFSYTFEQGHHYTVMIRKEGYYTKRMDAYVNVDGCILCFDGIDEIQQGRPEVSDNLTAGNKMGTIVSNVELVPIQIGAPLTLKNIHYASGKYDLVNSAKAELDRIASMLKNNPFLVVEIGSHTDQVGSDESNYKLSEKRAREVAKYLMEVSELDASHIKFKGYGESKLLKKCKRCSKADYAANRRTELKVIDTKDVDVFMQKSLKRILWDENFDSTIENLGGEVVIGADGKIPDDVLKDIKNAPSVADVTPTPSIVSTSSTETPKGIEGTTVSNTVLPVRTGAIPTPYDNIVIDQNYDGGEFEIVGEVIQRKPKTLDPNYSGFKIQFYSAPYELPLSHKIFSKHGNIVVEKDKNGKFIYCIGDFDDAENASDFLNHVIKPKYPKAKVLRFEHGKML